MIERGTYITENIEGESDEEAYCIGTDFRNGGCSHDAFRIRLCHDRAGAAQKESGGTGSEKQCDGIDADGSGCRPSDWDGFVDCHEGILKRQRRSDDFVYSGSFPDEDGRECLDTGNGGSWEASRVGKDQMRTVQEALEASKSGDYSKLKEQGFDAQALLDQVEKVTTLAPEAVTTGNQECYEMTSTISGSLLSGMLTDVMNSSLSNASGDGLDDQKRQIAEDILKSLSVNTKEDYNTETFLPVHMEMDLSGSDFSGLVSRIESLIRAGYTGSAAEPEEPQLSVTVNTLKASADYDFDTPVSIEVPEEARNTPVSESGLSADAVKGKAAGIDADQLIPDTDSQQET